MTVGVGGAARRVQRTYDSFDKTDGDFGVGWTSTSRHFRVSTNGPLGDGGWSMAGCGTGLIFVPLCFTRTKPHFVTVTWPDGRNEVFDLTPGEGSTFFSGLTTAEFTGRASTDSRLSATTASSSPTATSLAASSAPAASTTRRFGLTDESGTKYHLLGVGLLEIVDRTGNPITFGGTASPRLGPGINFPRDGAGRITGSGPDDNDRHLRLRRERRPRLGHRPERQGDTFTYRAGHYLESVLDPSAPLARTSTTPTDGSRR